MNPDTSGAVEATNAFPKTITLPSGAVATQTRPLKGRDVVAAQRITNRGAGQEGTGFEQGCALTAQVVQLGGKPVVMEDLLDMELDDLMALVEGVSGKSK